MTTQPPATAGADDAPVGALPYRVVDREHTGWWATAHAAQLRGHAPALGGIAGSGEHGEQPTGGGEPSVEGVAAELADAVRRRPSDGSRRDRILDWIGDTPIMHGESERPVPVASGDPRRMPCPLSDMYCLCGPPRNT